MSDLAWLLLWLAATGYVTVGLAAFLVGAIGGAVCALWHRLRPRRSR